MPILATRRFLIAALAFLGTGGAAAARVATPAQTPGPFYPGLEDRVGDTDWNLVRIAGRVREAGGEVLHLSGRVLDGDGVPMPGALIEIWQCDANGRYRHSADSAGGTRDPAFQGYGRAVTDANGHYRFRTIRPVPYPGRTPHIHARVHRPDATTLTTQLYVADDPRNARDWIFRSLGRRGQRAASMDLSRDEAGDWRTVFDFVV